MDKHQSIKRLGYGFSALVMALSTVTFVPGFSNVANAATCSGMESVDQLANYADGATICLSNGLTLDAEIAIDKNLTLDLNGQTITSTAATVFTVSAGKTLTIVGTGTISGTALTDGDDTVKVQGGKYNFDPTANLADGYAVYTDGTSYAVGAKTTYTATGAIYLPKGGEAAFNPGATPETVEGIANTISVVNVVDTDNSNKATSTVTVADGKVSVDAEAEAHNYQIQVKDSTGATKWVNHVIVYTLEVEDQTVTVNGDLTLTTALTGTNLPAGTTFALAEESEAAKIADDGVTFTATASGEYTVNYALADANATTGSFKVSVVPAASSDVVARNTAKDGDTYTGVGDTYYDAVVPETYAEVITVENNKETGKASVKLLQPWFGDVSYTFGGVAQTLKLRVYSVENDVYAKVGDSILLNDLANFPENVLARDGALLHEVKVSHAKGDVTSDAPALTAKGQLDKNYYYHATAAGTDTVSWKLANGTTETTTIHTYDENKVVEEIDDVYASLSDGDVKFEDITEFYEAASDDSDVTFTVDDDDAKVEDDKVTFTTTGKKTVTFTEKFGGKTINKVPMTIYITGLKAETINIFEGETAEITVAPYLGTITETAVMTGLDVESSDDIYTVSADEAGDYTLKFSVKEPAVITDEGDIYHTHTYTYTVNVYEKVSVETINDVIDLAVNAETNTATFKVSGTGKIVASEDVPAGEEAIFDSLEIKDGVLTVSLKENSDVKNGDTRNVLVWQYTTDGDLLAVSEPLTVKIANTDEEPVEPVEPTIVEVETDAQYTLAGSRLTFEVASGSQIKSMSSAPEEGYIAAGIDENDDTILFVAVHGTAKAGEYTITLETAADDENKITRTTVKFYVVEVKVTDAETGSLDEDLAMQIVEAIKEEATVDEYGNTIVRNDKMFIYVDDLLEALANGETLYADTYNYGGWTVDEYEGEDWLESLLSYLNNQGVLGDDESIAGGDIIDYIIRAGDRYVGEIYELDDAVEISLDIPEDYLEPADGYTRTFFVIRAHRSGYERIDDVTVEDGVITFANDKFSAFYIGYYDTLNASVDTGVFTGEAASASAANVALTAMSAVMAALLAAGAIKFAKRK